ncbi:MAG: hypothetical protein OEZ59_08655 [Deltaproteobacteria bacterium]|nr:hypothetical protein [Deltaproteobacteria bacterium]
MDPKEKMEKDFAREIEMRIGYFLESDEPELELEPMNSFRRRVVHGLASKYNLTSDSRGEGHDRYVCLLRGESAPERPARGPRLWDYGSQTFNVNPGEKGLRMALKVDGAVEIWSESEKKNIVADCLVTAREFRVRKGKILQPGDEGY